MHISEMIVPLAFAFLAENPFTSFKSVKQYIAGGACSPPQRTPPRSNGDENRIIARKLRA